MSNAAGFFGKNKGGGGGELSLLMHTNFTSGQAVTDSSAYNHSMSVPTGVNFAAQPGPFAGDTGSLYLDGGSSSYITMPDSPAWFWGLEDLCVDWWQRVGRTNTQNAIWQQSNGSSYRNGLNSDNTRFIHYFGDATAGTSISIQQTQAQVLNTWEHRAFVRKDGIFYMYVDGVHINTYNSKPTTAITDIAGTARIGSYVYSSGTLSFLGYMAEMRMLLGSAAIDNPDDLMYKDGNPESGCTVPTVAHTA